MLQIFKLCLIEIVKREWRNDFIDDGETKEANNYRHQEHFPESARKKHI